VINNFFVKKGKDIVEKEFREGERLILVLWHRCSPQVGIFLPQRKCRMMIQL
jgi:hypothetical protein